MVYPRATQYGAVYPTGSSAPQAPSKNLKVLACCILGQRADPQYGVVYHWTIRSPVSRPPQKADERTLSKAWCISLDVPLPKTPGKTLKSWHNYRILGRRAEPKYGAVYLSG